METETNSDKTNRELEKLSIEIEKLRAETANLKSIIRFVPVITGIVAVLVFCFGIYQFYSQQRENINQQKIEAENSQGNFERNVQLSEKEFRRKFYEKQLDLYLDLSQTAAQISTVEDKNKIQEKYQRFLELYNGNLIIVNTDNLPDNRVQNAADNFNNTIVKFKSNQASKTDLEESAKRLSAVLRNSLIGFWQIPIKEIQVSENK